MDALLREHLRTCPGCASLAGAVLAENAALAGALARLAAAGGAGATARPQEAAVATAARSARSASLAALVRRARWPAALIPLAAAAALLLVWLPGRIDPSPLAPLAGPAERVPLTPVVNAVGASAVAVMRTSDPNITVVWTF
jgi:hypothetical protein